MFVIKIKFHRGNDDAYVIFAKAIVSVITDQSVYCLSNDDNIKRAIDDGMFFQSIFKKCQWI